MEDSFFFAGLLSASTDSSRIQAVPTLASAGHAPRMVHPVVSANPQPTIVTITTVPSSSVTVTPTLNVPHVPLNIGVPRMPHHTQTFPPHLPRGECILFITFPQMESSLYSNIVCFDM